MGANTRWRQLSVLYLLKWQYATRGMGQSYQTHYESSSVVSRYLYVSNRGETLVTRVAGLGPCRGYVGDSALLASVQYHAIHVRTSTHLAP